MNKCVEIRNNICTESYYGFNYNDKNIINKLKKLSYERILKDMVTDDIVAIKGSEIINIGKDDIVLVTKENNVFIRKKKCMKKIKGKPYYQYNNELPFFYIRNEKFNILNIEKQLRELISEYDIEIDVFIDKNSTVFFFNKETNRLICNLCVGDYLIVDSIQNEDVDTLIEKVTEKNFNKYFKKIETEV